MATCYCGNAGYTGHNSANPLCPRYRFPAEKVNEMLADRAEKELRAALNRLFKADHIRALEVLDELRGTVSLGR